MMNGKRYPIRGFFAGLFAGLSVAIFLVLFGVIALGTKAIWVPVIVGVVLGVLWALFGPTRARNSEPTPVAVGAPAAAPGVGGPAAGEGPPPDTAPSPGAGPPPDTAPASGEGERPE